MFRRGSASPSGSRGCPPPKSEQPSRGRLQGQPASISAQFLPSTPALHDASNRSAAGVSFKLLWELRAIDSATEIPARSHQHPVSGAVQRRIPSPQPAEHTLASKYKHVFTNLIDRALKSNRGAVESFARSVGSCRINSRRRRYVRNCRSSRRTGRNGLDSTGSHLRKLHRSGILGPLLGWEFM